MPSWQLCQRWFPSRTTAFPFPRATFSWSAPLSETTAKYSSGKICTLQSAEWLICRVYTRWEHNHPTKSNTIHWPCSNRDNSFNNGDILILPDAGSLWTSQCDTQLDGSQRWDIEAPSPLFASPVLHRSSLAKICLVPGIQYVPTFISIFIQYCCCIIFCEVTHAQANKWSETEWITLPPLLYHTKRKTITLGEHLAIRGRDCSREACTDLCKTLKSEECLIANGALQTQQCRKTY